MYKLNLEKINQDSPYNLEYLKNEDSMVFVSDNDVEFRVYFDREWQFKSVEAYYFGISNYQNKKTPRDPKVAKTIVSILTNFLEENESCVLYMCETGDKKQSLRARLFSYWFSLWGNDEKYTLLRNSIIDEEGIENHIGLIVRNDNPLYYEIVNEFALTVKFFREKPDDE